MRAWHLLGLPSEDGERLRFFPPDSKSPLQLPNSIPVGDQEQIIAFFQQIITENPLPRTEVDWYHNGIDPGPRKFVEGLRARKGTSGVLLVIKIRSEGINAEEVLADPIAQMFEHTVISSQYHLKNTSLANLASLTKHVEQTLRELYREMANEIDLWRDGWDKLRPLLAVLLNPIDVVETVNSLIDIQLEEVVPEDPTDALKQRLLDRLLSARPCEELIVLSAYLLKNLGAGQELLEERWPAAERSLRSELLLSEGKLRGWAAWLTETGIDTDRNHALLRAGQKYSNHRDWEETQRWLDPKPHEGAHSSISAKLSEIFGLIAEGKLGRARAELDALNASVAGQRLPVDILNEIKCTEALFLRFFANRLRKNGRWEEAEPFFKKAIGLHDEGKDSLVRIAFTLHEYACGLRDNGRWSEAEPFFLQAIKLLEEGKAAPFSKAVTQVEYACGLRDNKRWNDAQSYYQEAFKLFKEGDAAPFSVAFAAHEYARGLRENGNWEEAEHFFKLAIELKQTEAGLVFSQGISIFEYARGLRRQGRWAEAEPLFQQALKQFNEGGASAFSRAVALGDYARGLRDNGRWSEAEPLFLQAMEIMKGEIASPFSKAVTLDNFARGLRDNGRWEEAEPLFKQAISLHEEAQDSPVSKALTLFEYARGLRDNSRWEEAESLFKQAISLNEQGGASIERRVATLRAYAEGLRKNGRSSEAEDVERQAEQLTAGGS